jgi:hypothetical protein
MRLFGNTAVRQPRHTGNPCGSSSSVRNDFNSSDSFEDGPAAVSGSYIPTFGDSSRRKRLHIGRNKDAEVGVVLIVVLVQKREIP